jgi:hypothetical protein
LNRGYWYLHLNNSVSPAVHDIHFSFISVPAMRLLEANSSGGYSLTEFIGRDIPPYAILSHTWGPDAEEVSSQDIRNGTASTKAGYSKIQFCSDQAARHGLRYCWVDTCCIDKSSSAELSEAINSMYAWYHNAARCYVYLADVSGNGDTHMKSFPRSRWFTRGWTLQELVAPASVEFFSADGARIGDKDSMAQQLHAITRISTDALQGRRTLHSLSVNERMAWIGQRETKREEDLAYSLLGIFDVCMPLLYGEGRTRAFARLEKEIQTQADVARVVAPPGAGSLNAHNGPVFYGAITGQYVIPATQVTGGTVNFSFQ